MVQKAYIQIQTKENCTGKISERMKEFGQVSSVLLTKGIFDILAHAEFENLEEANTILSKLRELEEVEHASVLLVDKIIE